MTRALLIILLLSASAVSAQTTSKTNSILGKRNTNQPIDVHADKFSADLNNKSFLYTGNVIVTQGDIRMHADAMKVNTDDGKPKTIQADGKVMVDSPASGTVTGDVGVYDVVQHTVVMTGKVVLTHGKDVMRGTHLTVNLDTGRAELGAPGASGVSGTQNGRVQGTFTPGN